MDVYEAIHARRDLEAFAEACPPREVIARLIEAATWAPSHLRTEPWHFHVVAGTRREAMTDTVASWLETTGAPEGAVRSMRNKIMRAPVTVIVSQTAPAQADALREREDYAACAAAIQNLLLAAHAEGLIAHLSTDRMMNYDATREYIGLGAGDGIVAMVNLGYLRAGADMKAGVRKAPSTVWDWE